MELKDLQCYTGCRQRYTHTCTRRDHVGSVSLLQSIIPTTALSCDGVEQHLCPQSICSCVHSEVLMLMVGWLHEGGWEVGPVGGLGVSGASPWRVVLVEGLISTHVQPSCSLLPASQVISPLLPPRPASRDAGLWGHPTLNYHLQTVSFNKPVLSRSSSQLFWLK